MKVCQLCGASIRNRMITFDRFFAKLVKDISKRCDRTLESKQLRHNTSFYARVGDLKYFGLLKQDTDKWHYGEYDVSARLHKFVANKTKVPKFCVVRHGIVVRYAKEKIGMRQAERMPIKHTAREYYEEARNGVN